MNNLLMHLKNLVAEERRITAELLRLLLEVENSKLFATLGCSSIYEFCVKELGYSDGSAYRRVAAMRLLKRETSCAAKIESGELSLSNAAKVETTLRQAKKQGIEISQEKLLQAALGGSSKDGEKKILEIARSSGVETQKPAIALPASIEEKLAQLRALLSQQYPYATKEEMLHLALDEALAKRAKTQSAVAGEVPAEVKSPNKRHIPNKLKAFLFRKAGNQCEHRSALTGRKCSSRHFLEIDHRIPFSMGGKTEANNLRILCRAHNQLAAAEAGVAWQIYTEVKRDTAKTRTFKRAAR